MYFPAAHTQLPKPPAIMLNTAPLVESQLAHMLLEFVASTAAPPQLLQLLWQSLHS